LTWPDGGNTPFKGQNRRLDTPIDAAQTRGWTVSDARLEYHLYTS
jgi:hypothetical protein